MHFFKTFPIKHFVKRNSDVTTFLSNHYNGISKGEILFCVMLDTVSTVVIDIKHFFLHNKSLKPHTNNNILYLYFILTFFYVVKYSLVKNNLPRKYLYTCRYSKLLLLTTEPPLEQLHHSISRCLVCRWDTLVNVRVWQARAKDIIIICMQ